MRVFALRRISHRLVILTDFVSSYFISVPLAQYAYVAVLNVELLLAGVDRWIDMSLTKHGYVLLWDDDDDGTAQVNSEVRDIYDTPTRPASTSPMTKALCRRNSAYCFHVHVT